MTEDKLKACDYVAAFIDVLGQAEKLSKFTKLPNISNEKIYKEFIETCKQTVGTVAGIQEHIETFFDAAKRRSAISHSPEPISQTVEDLTKAHVTFQKFSDGLLIYVPVAEDVVSVPMIGIHSMLIACGCVCLTSLAAHCPIRCGIDLGWGLEQAPGELYGSAVSSSYYLESKVCQYPRVVVGPELEAYLQYNMTNTDKSISGQMAKACAEICWDMLIADDDGYPMVDFLRLSLIEENNRNTIREAIVKAYAFVLAQSAIHKEKRSTKLAFRYSQLRNYFDHRVQDWGITQDEAERAYE